MAMPPYVKNVILERINQTTEQVPVFPAFPERRNQIEAVKTVWIVNRDNFVRVKMSTAMPLNRRRAPSVLPGSTKKNVDKLRVRQLYFHSNSNSTHVFLVRLILSHS
jgi:hypothetical protein